MPTTGIAMIERIRHASRRLVRELGFMDATLAGTSLPPSAVHAIIEVGLGHCATAGDLVAALRLEKSTVSRLVGSLVAGGYLNEARDEHDTRVKRLALTGKGQETFAEITAFAHRQVGAAVTHLEAASAADLARSLELYADALARLAGNEHAAPSFEIVQGYRPGLLGRTVQMHATYYSRAVGFGSAFEARVAADMATFLLRLDNPCNAIWSAVLEGQVVGTIAIDGEDLGGGAAHLRWFIVDDGLRGAGIGRALMAAAMGFVDASGFTETRLWTFRGLDAARRLYERAGFALVEEKPGRQWGDEVLEQQFSRPRNDDVIETIALRNKENLAC